MLRYLEFNESLLRSSTYDESFDAYYSYLRSLGFKSVSYAYMPNSPHAEQHKNVPRYSISKDFNKSFLQQYEDDNFYSHDYIIDALKKGKNNIMLWQQDLNSGQLSKQQERPLIIMKNDYQMGNGFSIPTSFGKNAIGAVSIIGDESDRVFTQLLVEHSREILIATNNFHKHVISENYTAAVFIMTTTFALLTKTEKQVLKCLLNGLAVPRIAESVFRSKGHVENLVCSIRIKIGGEFSNGKPRISKDELIHFCGLMQIYDEL